MGITKKAVLKDIKVQYLQLALKWHPDKKIETDAALRTRIETRFTAINKAYDTLQDPAKRAAYDACPAEYEKSKMTNATAILDFMRFCVEEIKAKQKSRRSPIKLFVMTLLPLGCPLGLGVHGAILSPAFTTLLNGGDLTAVLHGMSQNEKDYFVLATRTLLDESA